MGAHQHAADLFVRIFGIEERQIQNVFTVTSEADKLQFVQFLSGNLNDYLSLVHQHLGTDRPAVHDALGVLLRRKGVVFEPNRGCRRRGKASSQATPAKTGSGCRPSEASTPASRCTSPTT